jgi:hypothetical protein
VPAKSITPEQAAANLARAVEHQRLSHAIQEAAEGWIEWFVWLDCWKIIIALARETWDREKPLSYQDRVRHSALLDAADAIARAAIGEA